MNAIKHIILTLHAAIVLVAFGVLLAIPVAAFLVTLRILTGA